MSKYTQYGNSYNHGFSPALLGTKYTKSIRNNKADIELSYCYFFVEWFCEYFTVK